MLKYGLMNLEDELVFESSDEEDTAQEAIRLSDEKRSDIGLWTYRLESNDRIGGLRFFNNGREITKDIKSAILG